MVHLSVTVLVCALFMHTVSCHGSSNQEFSWEFGPHASWSTWMPVGTKRVDPSLYETNCTNVLSCIGDLDLSLDAKAGRCSNLTDGKVFASNSIKFPPYCLTRVLNGSLVFENNPTITMMSGFGNLVEINGDLVLKGNRNLVSLRGLDALERVDGDIIIMENGFRISLTELDDLVVMERYTQENGDSRIEDDELHWPRLVRRRPYPQLGLHDGSRSPYSSTIFAEDILAALETFNGLGSLQEIGGSLVVVGNPELMTFEGMENLHSIGDDLFVQANPRLLSFQGLSGLNATGRGIYVVSNANLDSLNGMDSLVQVGENFYVGKNEKLGELGSFPMLASILGNFTIRRNQNFQVPSSTTFGLTFVQESLWIEDNARLSSLLGLDFVTDIGKNLYVLRNPNLATLNPGFSGLQSVGGDMYVQGEFPDYSGFDSLQIINGSLTIHSLPKLETLAGLQALQFVENDVTIHLNHQLRSIGDLQSLQGVGGRLQVYGNEKLQQIDGMLDSLQYVLGYLQIDYINGTIDCPKGSGVGAGELPLIYDTTATDNVVSNTSQTFGNWCTMDCLPPLQVVSSSGSRMWECLQDDLWNPSWGPICS